MVAWTRRLPSRVVRSKFPRSARRCVIPSGGKRDLEGGCVLSEGVVFINATESQLLIILMSGYIGRAAAWLGAARFALYAVHQFG